MTETRWPEKPKLLTSWPFPGKTCQPWSRLVLLKLYCIHVSPGNLVRTQILIQRIWLGLECVHSHKLQVMLLYVDYNFVRKVQKSILSKTLVFIYRDIFLNDLVDRVISPHYQQNYLRIHLKI